LEKRNFFEEYLIMPNNLAEVKVEIVLPNYNSEAYLDETINSIINQTFKNWRLTIVDGNSNDETQRILQNYWYLLLAVLIGGQIGNFLNLKIFPTHILAFITAILVLFVACRMGFKIILMNYIY